MNEKINKILKLRALFESQNWPVRPVINLKKKIQYLFSLFSKVLLEPITAVRTILK